MMHLHRSPLVRSARIAWPLGWLACAQGVNTPDEAGDAAPDGAAPMVADSGVDRSIGPSVDTGVSPDPPDTGDEEPGAATMDATGGVDAAPDDEASTPDAPTGGTSVRRVFVSSTTVDGALGGHVGADATCQSLATAAALGGTWMAWLSDSSSSPSARFSKLTVGYALLDGTPVAASWTALSSSGPTHAIDLTETGESLATASDDASKTWTATLVTGALGAPSCGDFASNAATATGQVGHCTGTGTVNWTSAYSTESCNVPNHLYCFEQ